MTQAGVQRVTTFLRRLLRLLLPAPILALLAPTAASAMVPPVETSVPVHPNAPKVISATDGYSPGGGVAAADHRRRRRRCEGERGENERQCRDQPATKFGGAQRWRSTVRVWSRGRGVTLSLAVDLPDTNGPVRD